MREGIVDLDRFDVVPKTEGEIGLFERVVRCKDCRYNDPDREDNHKHFENACFYFADYEDTPAEVDPDGFCAWGWNKTEPVSTW